MCMDWFKKRPPVTWEHSNKVALLFGINQYGGGNNLNGCLNDIDTVKHMLPDFQIREFRDGEWRDTPGRSEQSVAYSVLGLIVG